MPFTRSKTAALAALACLAFAGAGHLSRQAGAEKPKEQAQGGDAVTELTPAQFGKFHALLRPKAKETGFGKIPWMFDLWEAREKAAAEGKPLLILGAAGNPCGTC